MWNLYDTILRYLPESPGISSVYSGEIWTMAETADGHTGLAMTTEGSTVAPRFSFPCAEAVKSWNLPEASAGMAVINACFNTPSRLAALGCEEPYENYCTDGVDFCGKTVGIVGHMNMPGDTLRLAKDVYILERHPQPGDYPDSACEYLLPKCDIALITGSSLVNKTLPRLLELCRNAYTIVTGPTVPMCPELLGCGIDRLAGLVITAPEGIRDHVQHNRFGPPYPYGKTFLLREDGL